MPKSPSRWLIAVFLAALATDAAAEQTILKAFAPADTAGRQVILVIDWSQVKAVSPAVTSVLLRRRPAGPPTVADTVAVLPADSTRFLDTGLDPATAYHYYAYFKKADGETDRFGTYPAVVHLGPLRTLSHGR